MFPHSNPNTKLGEPVFPEISDQREVSPNEKHVWGHEVRSEAPIRTDEFHHPVPWSESSSIVAERCHPGFFSILGQNTGWNSSNRLVVKWPAFLQCLDGKKRLVWHPWPLPSWRKLADGLYVFMVCFDFWLRLARSYPMEFGPGGVGYSPLLRESWIMYGQKHDHWKLFALPQ